jgi:hypothetical protein
MLQLRVYRLNIPFTMLGLELWALATVGFGTLMFLQLYSGWLPSFLPLPAAALTGFGFMKFVGFMKSLFPGRSFLHTVYWLTSGDRYIVRKELKSAPLIVPERNPLQRQPTRSVVWR